MILDEAQQRWSLADRLVTASLVGLTVISLAGIYKSTDKDSTANVFNALLPLFGTWIGTVLAYYFSKANFAQAAATVQQATNRQMNEITVSSAMTPLNKIIGLKKLADGEKEDNLTIKDLLSGMKAPATRIPVLGSTGSALYILHESTLNKFIARQAVERPAEAATVTLANLLADPDLGRLAKTFGIVAADTTLAETKQKMEETPNCSDVFVTQTGKPAEPVLGWLTNVTLEKYSKL